MSLAVLFGETMIHPELGHAGEVLLNSELGQKEIILLHVRRAPH